MQKFIGHKKIEFKIFPIKYLKFLGKQGGDQFAYGAQKCRPILLKRNKFHVGKSHGFPPWLSVAMVTTHFVSLWISDNSSTLILQLDCRGRHCRCAGEVIIL